jgi:hypothetical protein
MNVAQAEFLNLAAGDAGQRIDDFEAFGYVLAGQLLGATASSTRGFRIWLMRACSNIYGPIVSLVWIGGVLSRYAPSILPTAGRRRFRLPVERASMAGLRDGEARPFPCSHDPGHRMTAPHIALVVGARGGIGSALCDCLRAAGPYGHVIGLSRPAMDITDEASIGDALARPPVGELRLVVNAVGFLHGESMRPEKNLRQLDAVQLARSFAINAIGPALLLKHVLPRLPREGRSVVASLSARVGSIGDNRLGGWYGYRAPSMTGSTRP